MGVPVRRNKTPFRNSVLPRQRPSIPPYSTSSLWGGSREETKSPLPATKRFWQTDSEAVWIKKEEAEGRGLSSYPGVQSGAGLIHNDSGSKGPPFG